MPHTQLHFLFQQIYLSYLLGVITSKDPFYSEELTMCQITGRVSSASNFGCLEDQFWFSFLLILEILNTASVCICTNGWLEGCQFSDQLKLHVENPGCAYDWMDERISYIIYQLMTDKDNLYKDKRSLLGVKWIISLHKTNSFNCFDSDGKMDGWRWIVDCSILWITNLENFSWLYCLLEFGAN